MGWGCGGIGGLAFPELSGMFVSYLSRAWPVLPQPHSSRPRDTHSESHTYPFLRYHPVRPLRDIRCDDCTRHLSGNTGGFISAESETRGRGR